MSELLRHSLQMCLDEEDRVWFMLHSGSRGPGNRIGTVYIELAKNDMLKLDKQVKVLYCIRGNSLIIFLCDRWTVKGNPKRR